MESRNQLVLVGVVTGNPSKCDGKTLPDVFNFVGNQEVNRNKLMKSHIKNYIAEAFSYYNLRYISVISDSAMD